MNTPLENRRFPRHPVEIPIEIRKIADHALSEQYIKNLSVGGMAFEFDNFLEKNELVCIRVMVNCPFELMGRVVWCCEKQNNKFEVGVEFVRKVP